MESVPMGGQSGPILSLGEKIIEHKTQFTWAFIIMAAVIIILLAILLWPKANEKAKETFRTEFNQLDFSGITGSSRTNEKSYNEFADALVKQGFNPDPRTNTQRTFDANFQGKR